MAEPTLSYAYSDVRSECGWEMGFGRDSSVWGTDETTHIDAVQKAAMVQAHYPPNGHRWSFMKPSATLTTWRTISGTVSAMGAYDSTTGLTQCTATTSIFHSTDPGHPLVFGTGGTFTIDTYVSGTVVYVQGNASAASGSISVTGDDTYRAPDDFDAIVHRMYYASASEQGWSPLENVSVDNLVWMRDDQLTGMPRYFAVKPVLNLAGQQRWDFMFYPEPDSEYTLAFRYRVNPNNLTSTSTAHYGGVWFSQLLLASARSAAEFEIYREHGPRHADFLEKLAAATKMDRDTQAQTMGYIGDSSGDIPRRNVRVWNPTVTRDY